MKQLLIIFFVIFTMSAISCKDKNEAQVKIMSAEEMQILLELEDVQLVDVRTVEEYEEGFIKNAQNIDFNSPTFEEEIKDLDKTKPVILYCKSGNRSAKCGKKLIEAGFVKIYDLEGGISKWKHKGKTIKTES